MPPMETNIDSAIMHGVPELDTIPEDVSATGSAHAAATRTPMRAGWMTNDSSSMTAGSVAFSTQGVIDESPNSPEGPTGPAEGPNPRPSPGDPDQVLKCRPKMSWKMWVILILLAAGVAVGIYYIVHAVQDSGSAALVPAPTLALSPAPSAEIVTDDFLPTDHPSMPPSHPPSRSPSLSMAPSFPLDESSQATAAYLEGLMGPSVYDPDEPEGQAMEFIIYTDQQKVRLDSDGEDRVTQRYILCHFYFTLNGDRWTTDNFLNDAHECDWDGIICPDDDLVVKRIFLDGKNLVGRLPTEMPYLSTLENVWLSNNDLQGSIPDAWFTFPELTWLDLSKNDLIGTLTASVWGGPRLKVFRFHDNWIKGPIPEVPTVDNSTSIPLLEFDGSRNLIDGQVPASLFGLANLTFLYLDSNQLTGVVPSIPDDALVRNLQVIWLQNNKLQGTLPESLVSLPSLEKIRLGSNQLSSTIPESWFQMENLRFLGLAGNQLTGTIPNPGNAIGITNLNLNNNSLSGNLPELLPQSISVALFQHNELIGMIPPDYAVGRQNLTMLQLQGNMLTGTLSPSLCGKVTMQADCMDDTAPFYVQCECCDGC